MPPPEMPPLSRLEQLVLDSGQEVWFELGFDQTCDRYRVYLRNEIDRRLRELARKEPVEVVCSSCGEIMDVSPSHAEKLSSRPAPRCASCKSPERAAQEDTEAARFVEQLGESARELAGVGVIVRASTKNRSLNIDSACQSWIHRSIIRRTGAERTSSRGGED